MISKQLTNFYIVRHGQTDGNIQQLLQGHMDIPLNDTGRQQAKETAEKLRKIKFDLAFSSDLMRARETTEIIALEHNLEVQTTQLLRERHFGENEGKNYAALKAFDNLFQSLSYEKQRVAYSGKNAENDEEICTRLITFIRETAITHPGQTILVGTHGGIMRAFLIHLGFLHYKTGFDAIENLSYFLLKSDGVDFFIKDSYGINTKA